MFRDNHAPAGGGRGVVFVGGNSAAFARPQYARRTGGPPGTGAAGQNIQAQIAENIARHGEKAVEGPPQVHS